MSQQVRVLHLDTDERVESGAVKFVMKGGYEDWPGLFLRGDNAAFFASMLDAAIKALESDPKHFLTVQAMKGVRDDIRNDVIVGGW